MPSFIVTRDWVKEKSTFAKLNEMFICHFHSFFFFFLLPLQCICTVQLGPVYPRESWGLRWPGDFLKKYIFFLFQYIVSKRFKSHDLMARNSAFHGTIAFGGPCRFVAEQMLCNTSNDCRDVTSVCHHVSAFPLRAFIPPPLAFPAALLKCRCTWQRDGKAVPQ